MSHHPIMRSAFDSGQGKRVLDYLVERPFNIAMTRKHNIVFSTDPAFKKRCERCGSYPCRCPKAKSLPPQQQNPRVWRDRKGRGGKTVTIVRELQLAPDDLTALAKQLKKICGAGGAIKDGSIEIQGDHRDKVAAELEKLGYKAKLAGG